MTDIQVTDKESGKPIAGVSVMFFIEGRLKAQGKTDENGECKLIPRAESDVVIKVK